MIRRILVGLGDATYAESATKTAIVLARAHGAELTGISVLDHKRLGATGPVPIGAGHLAVELKEHRLASAREIIDQVDTGFEMACREAGITCNIEQPEGEPYQSIADQARYHDVIVCGLSHLFEHGVVDEPPEELVKLVRAGVRPLITVPGEHRSIERVLVAYSGSMESAKAMKRFVQLQLWPDATVRVVTFRSPHGAAHDLLVNASKYCLAHGIEADTEFVDESPTEALLPYADDWGADLIVLGNSNRNLLLRRIFGETMLHVVHHTDRPLFLAQ